jgi:thioredoxin 1
MIYLDNNNFEEKIKESVCIVDFFAQWCGPCKMMSPIFEALAEEYNGKCNFFKIDVDENSEIAEKFSVMSIPTLVIFKNGEKVATNIGALPKDALKNFIDKNL